MRYRKNLEKVRALFLNDNLFNKPLKEAIRKLGLYSHIYNIFEKFEMHDDISMRLIKKLVERDNPIVLEIGAHIGQDTKRFLKSFRDITLYAFEPDPRAREQFMKNVRSSHVKLIPFAISEKNGYITLHQSSGSASFTGGKEAIDEWTTSSTIKKPIRQSAFVKYEKDIKVKTMKLDNWVKKNEIEIIDFIWADVEGSERELITGGLHTLNEKTRYFYTEFSDNAIYEGQPKLSEIQKMLPKFKIIGIYGSNVLMKNTSVY